MKSNALAVILATLGVALVAAPVHAEESPWLVRARATHLNPADKSAPVAGAGASDRISVESRTIAELDISYFFSPNIAAELVLTYPQKHSVYLDGKEIGTFKHLPPTLLAQYHFVPSSQFSPYVGAGVNLTRISSVRLLGGTADLESNSVGLALQAGIDFKIDKNWSVNLDIKRVNIRSDVMAGGATISAVKVDPMLASIGVGYRF
ncbi:OmpW/AlkL family protein [Massilia soli]|uniref:Outer membrane beta-barrel protein n=1 Tax=Massilia soli TaxID=2792854 RepID=A0ABS7SR74_9BURK|nr:OmpW family outer membrane protein [Massilia soli]MBZ2208449.1 outer membrane beta-barrel protein [Massilia soli]